MTVQQVRRAAPRVTDTLTHDVGLQNEDDKHNSDPGSHAGRLRHATMVRPAIR